MDSSSTGHPVGPLYALVSYIPGPLGEFLNGLRSDLVPRCRLLSHLTLLPPRVLHSPVPQLEEALNERLTLVEPFEVNLGDIKVFDKSRVVFLSIASGQSDAVRVHSMLSQGVLDYDEPWNYHPHITLAQEFPPDQFDRLVDEARQRWAEWAGPRSFQVEELVFVRNRDANTWDTLSEYRLSRNGQPFRAIRTVESAAPLLP